MATRSLLEEQITVVLESGKKDDAMWHVLQTITFKLAYNDCFFN